MNRSLAVAMLAAALGTSVGTSRTFADDGAEPEQESETGGRRGRAEHDVRVKLKIGDRRSATPLAKIRLRNRGTAYETGVQVRLTAGSEDGVELWSGTADVAPGRAASFRFRVAPPVGTEVLVASAWPVGAADERPDDNVSRAGLRKSGSTGDRIIGAALYAANCASCHGNDARGTGLAPNIVREPASEILEAIREGEGGMPTFPGLSSRDVACLAAFLRDPDAATPAPTPTPTPTPGTAPTYSGQVKSILDRNCASCHGGTSPTAGVALDSFAGASANAARALTAVKAGRMPPAGPLPAADVRMIEDWILGGTNP